MKQKFIKVLGVMTGTSCDGLDVSCLEVSPGGWSSLWQESIEYPELMRKRIFKFQQLGAMHSGQSWLELHRDLGEWYGNQLKKLLKLRRGGAEVIANHGQTVAHFPTLRNGGMTLQLGDGTRISAATGLTVVTQFRDGDMAAGGQGAPLTPLFHQMLVQQSAREEVGVAVHNLGGIGNLTYLGPGNKMIAFDTGPGNIWIDAAVARVTRGKSRMDRNGKISSQGKPDEAAVRRILKHPYFSKSAPKSTGRNEFPVEYFFSRTRSQGASLVRTAVAVTVESIAKAYEAQILGKNLPLSKIFLCGGGAKNITLCKELAGCLPSVRVSSAQEWGLDPQFVEAQAFAIYGFLTLLGHPLGGKWTGARAYGPPGHIIPGDNWQVVLEKISSFLS